MKNQQIARDIEKIEFYLKDNFVSASLFGSYSKKPYGKINDIDILIQTKNKISDKEMSQIEKINLGLPIRRININAYGGGGGGGKYYAKEKTKTSNQKTTYDFVFVDAGNSNCNFMKINNKDLVQIV